MFQWLIKKGQNGRVAMCAKELQCNLESLSPQQRAYRMALAIVIIKEGIGELSPEFEVINNPFNYSRDDCYKIYYALETMFIANKSTLSQMRSSLPQFAEHTAAFGDAVLLWMATIGVGIRPESRDNVRLCWDYIRASHSFLLVAIDSIYETNQKMDGAMGAAVGNMKREEWAKAATFIPKCFSQKLN
jgi:hypothetical protein